MKKKQGILVLDFGSQYTRLLVRRVRELGVWCDLRVYNDCNLQLSSDEHEYIGIMLSGGPASAATLEHTRQPGDIMFENFSKHDDIEDVRELPRDIFNWQVPILGICYGMQALARKFGGDVKSSANSEYGKAEIKLEENAGVLLDSLRLEMEDKNAAQVWMSHADHVNDLPPCFYPSAISDGLLAAFHNDEKKVYGLQFHPEVTHTKLGKQILQNFVIDVCGADQSWKPVGIIDNIVERVRKQVSSEKVLLGLSGGVDSSVTALLLQKAIGNQLSCVLVDNGLLRLGEVEQVVEFMSEIGVDLHVVDARAIFLRHLKGITDPEHKRKVIGKTFIEVFETQTKDLGKFNYLAQGTIYPDVIESAGIKGGVATVIKSHHNVGGLPDQMNMELVEPLRDLFKDEVRAIGRKLGLIPVLVDRHPFPGPGLAVRCIGEITEERLDVLRQADDIFVKMLIENDLYDKVAQAFVVHLPVESVGVVGDQRRTASVLALRAVETLDFMTANWARLPYDFLELVSNKIIREVPQVSRVVYDISSKPPATIEWE